MKTIPCKTFLVGEYAVLLNGEALGLATSPGFSLSTVPQLYHPESAVSMYLGSQSFYRIDSTAPGGFGKSTAEFLLAYLSKNKSADLKTILETYLGLYDTKSTQRPSGADIVIQCLGGVSRIAVDKAKSQRITWPFDDFGFSIVSTGLKIATHDHLKALNRKAISDLPELSKSVIEAFARSDASEFMRRLSKWKNVLIEKGLAHPQVISLMQNLQEKIAQITAKPFVIKQCGAFGADVIIIIFEKHQKDDINRIIKTVGLNIIATESELSDGALF